MFYGISPQTQAVMPSGVRRKFGRGYTSELRSRYGSATQMVMAEQTKKQEDQAQADAEHRWQEEQKFQQEQMDLEKDQAAHAEKQGMISTGLSAVGTGLAAAPYIKSGAQAVAPAAKAGAAKVGSWLGLGGSSAAAPITATGGAAAGSGAAAGAGSAATGAGAVGGVSGSTGAGATAGSGAAAGGGGSGAGGLGSAIGTAGWVAAAIVGQELMARGTKTEFEGQRTGSVFTQEDGNWRPRFGNDPWIGYTHQQMGLGPSAGEKWDAAMYNQDWGTLAKRTPAAVHQWLDPAGSTLTNTVGGYADRQLGSTAGEAVRWALDPIGSVANKAADSYLCTAVHNIVGLSLKEAKSVLKLRNYIQDNPNDKSTHYFKFGAELVKRIGPRKETWKVIKEGLVDPVVKYVQNKEYDKAIQHYTDMTLVLVEEFAPDLRPDNAQGDL